MAGRTRVGVLALIGTISVPVVIAGMAWACGPSGYGTPEAPPAPPASTAAPVTPPTASPTPPTGSGSTAPPVQVTIESGAASTGSVDGARTAPQTPRLNATAPRTTAPTPAARADINARINGATAGVVQSRGQTVFKSSTAPKAAKAARGKSTARPTAKSTPAVSERAATGDLWGGLATADANLASAAALGKNDGGLSGGLVAALAILGLGLAGLTGGALATAGRRRKAAGAAKRP